MGTDLGGRGGGSITVQNTGTDTIERFRCAVLDEAVAAPYGGGTEPLRRGDEYVVPAQTTVAHTAGAAFKVGVVQSALAAGELGTAIVRGVSVIETDTTVGIAEGVSMALPAASDGVFTDDAGDGFAFLTDIVEWVDSDFTGSGTAKQFSVAVLSISIAATVTLT